MQQTLLALCAIAIFAFYTLNSARDEASLEMRSVTAEVEQAAASLARERLASAERLAFDEQDVGRGRGIRLVPPTSIQGPDGGETDAAMYDDLDDLPGALEAHFVNATGPGMVGLSVVYSVRYVVPATLATAPGATLAKELRVTVTEQPGAHTRGRPPVGVVLKKVFTPAGMASFR